MAAYGTTWWGKKWLESFNGIDIENRLPRGKTYANTGRAYDIKIKGSVITAKVRGSMPRPYDVEVVLNPFSETDKKNLHEIIANSSTTLSALINKKLPPQFLDELNARQIKLFPSNWREIKASCNCPDWAVPCKHIAAVIYLICAEIDKNPFVVFNVHDCDLLDLISDFGDGKLERAQKILLIDDVFPVTKSQSSLFDQSSLDKIYLSEIPNLGGRIHGILSDSPPFYEKNFREFLQLTYKHWQRFPNGKVEHFYYSPTFQAKTKTKAKKELTEEEIFCEKWNRPEKWSSFQLVIDERHQLIQVLDKNTDLFRVDSKHSSYKDELALTLIKFLRSIPSTLLHKLNPELRFTQALSLFASKLMEQSAFIPQILQNQKDETLIRWIPALFDESVNEVYKKFCAICPQELVKYKDGFSSPQDQVKAAMALIFSGYIGYNLPAPVERHQKHKIFQLFFRDKAQEFKEFSEKEIPATINQWLSNFYLSEKPHKLYLMVEEKEEFELHVKVALDHKKEPIHLEKALSTADSELRLSLLADLALLTEYIPEFSKAIDKNSPIFFDLDHFAPLFLTILPVLKAIGIAVILPKSLQKILRPELNLKLKSKKGAGIDRKSFLNLETLLNFDWQVAIGDKKLSIDEFKKLLKASRGLVRLVDQYVLLDEKEIQALLKKLDELPEKLNQSDLMQAVLAGEFNGANVEFDKQLTSLSQLLGSYTPVSIPKNLKAQLRPYQERGFGWLVQNIQTNFGSILADDMGLGKTVQVIAALLYFKNEGLLNEKRVLIVAPTSLLSNWRREVERFAPDLKIHIYHGQNRELVSDYDILITSYGLARRDKQQFSKMKWFALVVDEAQNIKNSTTEQTKAIKAINAQHKIAMSGTPVENRLLEYWSIFDFTNKHYLGSQTQFKERFASPIEKDRDKNCLDRFSKVTRPFILRRLKSDKSIIQDLPDKIENNHYCSLTPEQTALYEEVVKMTMKKIEKTEGIERKGLVLKLINALKQVCNHPSHFGKKKNASIEQSGKTQMLEEILSSIDATGEKSLIFTQYTEMGNIIVKLLEEKTQLTVPFLHGGLSRKMRDEMVHDFQSSPQNRIFIVSLKAGGTGLNLTAASHVIHYDLWWNPAVEAQATDRAYRIGQQRNVMVHRLITTGTFEERIDEMIQSKKDLANLTVGSSESWVTEMSNEQLKDLVSLRTIV